MNDKSVLVVKTPKNCDECRICARAEIYDYCAYLGSSKGEFIYPNGYAELAIGMSNCPLRPLPQKKVGDDLYERYGSWTLNDEKEVSYRVGFNDCINEITGGEE